MVKLDPAVMNVARFDLECFKVALIVEFFVCYL